jgi:hypothetical protein
MKLTFEFVQNNYTTTETKSEIRFFNKDNEVVAMARGVDAVRLQEYLSFGEGDHFSQPCEFALDKDTPRIFLQRKVTSKFGTSTFNEPIADFTRDNHFDPVAKREVLEEIVYMLKTTTAAPINPV